ncbi:hypothetical protein LTR37_009656 [Vermiconidia calcicola]|uniref:Uncharacterized protein n=1 Tax=Vermiconidia calcicola TaxID=1690605 RepID=A0ACC3N8J9_9PEZI|nr:hypothetical protein LTR37_009656 [Vermiconidia calcicola]
MAPSRGKGKARAAAAPNGPSTSTRRTTRSTRKSGNAVPDVFQDMLAEAVVTEPIDDTSDRPLKKRKVAKPKPPASGGETTDDQARPKPQHAKRTLQTAEASSASEDEDESEFGFEDVDLQHHSSTEGEDDNDGIADVSISLDPATTPKRRAQVRRKPASAVDKAFRLLVHKMHVLYLLGHCMFINSRCDNEVVHLHLRPLLSKKTVSYLNPKTEDSQFQRNRSFMDGLLQASEAFHAQFKVTVSGMRRAKWATDDGEEGPASPNDTEPMDRADFITAARDMEGSQDTGNQLFCAMLRSVGVEARLVCSLQPLPFANISAKSSTPQKPTKPVVYAMASGTHSAATDTNHEDSGTDNSNGTGKIPSARRRLGQPTFASEPVAPTSTPVKKKKAVRKLTYPIFWTEAFNAAHQKWVPVDPIITQTIAKPTKFEPPSSYEWNQMSYVLAFEPDCVARDVTRRYTKAFNAKTRRQRVESTEGGSAWLKKALRIFRRRGEALDRDAIEDAELAQREAKEGMPANVLDFKDHPYYALERHMKRHEVLSPKREVGKVNAGTAAKPRMEAVYRRQDVLVCRSADKWFRGFGRIVTEGEVPVKRVPAQRSRAKVEESEDEREDLTPLYAPHQTEVYVPPPVENGRVPRNAYGNLDIYVPSMVPAGGAHIRHALARDAARLLGAEYADAVTGFQFNGRGRKGTAVVEGVIVAAEQVDAVNAVIQALQDEKVEEESRGRSAVALRMWKRFLTGLRIQERVSSTYGEKRDEEEMDERGESTIASVAGGFLPAEAMDVEEALPTAGRFSLEQLSRPAARASAVVKKAQGKVESPESEEEADFTADESVEVYEPSIRPKRGRRKIVDDESEDEDMPVGDDGDGGGFVPDDALEDGEGGGGFVPEEDTVGDGSGGGFVPEDAAMNDGSGGGFMPENATANDGGGGGYMPNDMDTDDSEYRGDGGFIGDDEDMIEEETILGTADIVSNARSGVGGLPEQSDDTDPRTRDAVPSHEPAVRESTDVNDDTIMADSKRNQERHTDHEIQSFEILEGQPVDQFGATRATIRLEPFGNGQDQDGERDQLLPSQAQDDGESDRGSMLSHDPEDEDAEPDWLDSD